MGARFTPDELKQPEDFEHVFHLNTLVYVYDLSAELVTSGYITNYTTLSDVVFIDGIAYSTQKHFFRTVEL